jgi:beta-N-acetylhexosaminidase
MDTKYWGSIPGSGLSKQDIELLPMLTGLVLFRENLQEDISGLIKKIKAVNPSIEVAIDHEGGRVNRFGDTMKMQAAQTYIELNDESLFKKDLVHDFTLLKEMGIDRVFGPCVDINLASQGLPSKVIGELGRSFGASYEQLTRWTSIYIEVAHQCGLKTCLKHFPDHGYCQEDSHLELPFDLRTKEEIAPVIAFYESLISKYAIDMVMLAHVALPNVTRHNETITFDANIKQMVSVETITDCLGMKAIEGSPFERIARAQKAGHEHIMLTHQPPEVLKAAILGIEQGHVIQENQSVMCSS